MLIIAVIVFIIILYLFFICPRITMGTRMSPFLRTMFAHRGYHCQERSIPENSMAAFQAALQRGYGIELDVHLTRDQRLVVFHDHELKRMCGTAGIIEEMTFAELKLCRLLGTAEGIPLLTDVLSLVQGQVPLLIELKMPNRSLAICNAVHEILKHYTGPYLIQSFNTFGIRWFRLHAPDILRGQLSSNLLKEPAQEPAMVRLLVKHLLVNFLGRPDFISYKLADLPRVNLMFLRHVFHTPIAVWTLRSESAIRQGRRDYDIQIFEKQYENY